ncbi:TonB-dependent receptor plug domain-containing protein [Colwellia sp. 75C3]|uniref:TonB-dependent receptor plug domain-containing protein n=1 Tax=Colwellia sp. 75C3 TaxID=888425 RepID=UPI0018E2D3BA|nr:TonB-dependent receptor [Colwellia sp. 75C3]
MAQANIQVLSNDTEIDPFSLSLEQLLKIQVTSTSRSNTEAKTSEGIITVITAEEITLYGAKNLVDVLQRLPGTLLNADSLTPRDVLSVRGDRSIAGDHVLFLINGRPFRISAFSSSASRLLLYGFPLKQVKQIEFIQGSASVLYGANAYSAVVNIITKDANESADFISGTVGDNSAMQLQFNGGIVNKGFSANMAGNYFKSQGWDSQFLDSDLTTIEHNLVHDNLAFWAELQVGDNSISGYSNKLAGNYYGLKTPFDTNETFEDDVQYIDMGYQLYNADNLQSKFSLSNIWYESYSLKSNELNLDFENQFQFTNSRLLIGANLNQIVNAKGTSNNVGIQVDEFSSDLYSLFSHYNYRYHDTNLIIGAMWLKFSGLESHWVPRLGIVHQFNPQWVAKILYNEGYRAPNAIETSLNIFNGLVIGNKLLAPEHIKTVESQISYSKNQYHLAVSAFKSTQDQLINIASSSQNMYPRSFYNTEQREFIGGAIEARYRYQNWDIQSSYSIQKNKQTQFLATQTNIDDITQMPQHTFKLGVSYKFENYSVSVFDNYSSKYPTNALDLSADVNEQAGEDHNISFNMLWNFDQQYEGLSLSLYINNLLDEALYVKQFETTENSINSYPHETSRAAYLTLAYQF